MSLKHAILVLLENSPGSGYDLAQRFASGIGYFWNSTHQQIYQELKALHGRKWVGFQVETQAARPEKKVYRITPAGRRALQAWFHQPVKPPRVRDALLIKLYGAHLHERAAVLAELDRRRAVHAAQLARYRAIEQGYFAADTANRRRHRLPYLTLRRGIRYEQESLDWLAEVRDLIERDALPEAPLGRVARRGSKTRR